MSDKQVQTGGEPEVDPKALLMGVAIVVALVWFVRALCRCLCCGRKKRNPNFTAIADKYKSIAEVQQALRNEGLESSSLIVGIDFTKSNEWTGAKSFGGRCLHEIDEGNRRILQNPYEESLAIIGETLSDFDDDNIIPAYGFGDATTTDKAVFSLAPYGGCHGLLDVLKHYKTVAKRVLLSGPTSFVPLVRQAIEIVKKERSYHVLVIVADGQVTNVDANARVIVEASRYPLSIILIGVGDGPFDVMEDFDDNLKERKFDNFQFVNFSEIKRQTWELPRERQRAVFALHALMEIPDQYKAIRQLGYL